MSAGATASPLRQQLVDDAVLAYVDWREECATVWAAYNLWTSAPREDVRRAQASYWAALDREEAAAHLYANLMKRASELLNQG